MDEEKIEYDPAERGRYIAREPSAYDAWAWPDNLLNGRDRRASRCFPEVAARAHFETQGYKVLISAPKYPDELGYLLFHFRGLRRRKQPHPAFARMERLFPGVDLHELAETARLMKIDSCGNNGGGGDPDLFAFRASGDRLFVEAKHLDDMNCNQRVCFGLIRDRLRVPVKIVRLVPRLSDA